MSKAGGNLNLTPSHPCPYSYVDRYETITQGIFTTVPMVSEENLIERVRKKFPVSGRQLRVGIGDDAAVLRPQRGEWVITTDAFLEGIHFLRTAQPPGSIGYKGLARATSDLAAMGATPRYFLMSLALPSNCAGKWLDDFLNGMAGAARRFGLVLAGGDTTKNSSILVNLTVLGQCGPGRAILRSGAWPGDAICVSGKLGESELGLRLIQKRLAGKKQWKHLLQKQFYPEPRLELGQWLAKGRRATAMIDTSDGLSTDLGHLCKSSDVGAEIWADRIPLVGMPPELRRLGLDPLEMALHGGEDYELLFTVSQKSGDRLPRRIKGVPIHIIGRITRKKSVLLIPERGTARRLTPGGWDPFRMASAGRR